MLRHFDFVWKNSNLLKTTNGNVNFQINKNLKHWGGLKKLSTLFCGLCLIKNKLFAFKLILLLCVESDSFLNHINITNNRKIELNTMRTKLVSS